jgi:Cytochrome P460
MSHRRLTALALLAFLAAACGGATEPEPLPAAPAPATTSEEATTENVRPPPPQPPPRKQAKAPPGVPRFVAGYTRWVRLSRKPIPPRASDPHNGTKLVFATSRPGADGLFPNGTVIVKQAVRPGADFVGLIAIMRKTAGADPAHNDWTFVEYTRASAGERFTETASGTVCWSCHIGAKATDYVFTLGR